MYSQINEIINEIFDSSWTATEVDLDNINYVSKVGVAYIQPRIYTPSVSQVAIGQRERATGYVAINVFVPRNTDTRNISDFADMLMTLFRLAGKQIPHMVFKSASAMRQPSTKEWYSTTVTVPFTYDECY